MKPVSFLSFDIEALPGRAENDHVNRLIWGKVNNGEYGIKKISAILNEYGIKGNFLLDLSGCVLYSDRLMQEVGRYILSQGHELHVHLHSEWLIRKWGIKGEFNGPAGLNQIDLRTNIHFLEWCSYKFRELFGFSPTVFRGGGYHFNEHTIVAAKVAGFKCLTNVNTQRHADMLTLGEMQANNEPYLWENGVIELPVDFSPEPLSFDIKKYYGWFDRVKDRKKIKTFNLTMHSWSLMKRNGEYFSEFSPEHEERLRYICEHLKKETDICGYNEYINSVEFPTVESAQFNFTTPLVDESVSLHTCPICAAIFSDNSTDVCPGCHSRARHRQIFDAVRQYGNPFIGSKVLTNYANSVEKMTVLSPAREVVNFDIRPVDGLDIQMDIQNMSPISSGSFDGFMAVHVLNHVKDDRAALSEINRILKPGGVALITVPYREGEDTTEIDDIFQHYGKDSYEKFGVGSYRRYGLSSVTDLFSNYFSEIKKIRGYDSLTNSYMYVFLLKK